MKTLKSGKIGRADIRVVDTGMTLVAQAQVNGKETLRFTVDSVDNGWKRLHDEIGKTGPRYAGFSGALNRFLNFYPGGFHSEDYEKDERNYKLVAKASLDRALPLSEAADSSGAAEAILSVFRLTNLLFPIEKARMQEVLRGPRAGEFIRAAARFALGDTKMGLRDMERALKPHNAASWTAVTYLPFLWRPDTDIFLKPLVTKDFAERVGHRFATEYDSRLSTDVYHCLLDLVSQAEAELIDLKPRDRIDIQSFIWVVGDPNDAEQGDRA